MIVNHLKITFRNILRKKGFSLLNIVGLSIGLTCCFLIALFVWDEMQFDKSIPGGDRIYRLYTQSKSESNVRTVALTPPMFASSLKSEFPEVEETATVYNLNQEFLFEVEGKKMYEAGGISADGNFFKIFPLKFTQETQDNLLKGPGSIIISTVLADKYFKNINAIGKQIKIDENPYLVTGVFEADKKFHLPMTFIVSHPLSDFGDRMQSWTWQNLNSYVKLKNGADIRQLERKFSDYVIKTAHPITLEKGFSYMPYFQRLHDIHLYSSDLEYDMAVRGNITYVNALGIITIFILIIACFNFVNLATARATHRAKEVGVRKTIGATKGQLISQFITETFALVLISLLLSIALTYLFLPWLNEFSDKEILFPLSNPIIILLLIGLTAVISLLAGFYPAIVMSGFKPVNVLKGNMSGNESFGKKPWLRHGLVVIQFSLSVLLIISALVVFRQVNYLHNKDLGFNKEELLFFPMRGDNMSKNSESFKNELKSVPGVSAVSIGYGFPGDLIAGETIKVPLNGAKKDYPISLLIVDADYLETLGIKVIEGRNFVNGSQSDRNHGFVINETAVKKFGYRSAADAIGKPLEWNMWNPEDRDTVKVGNIIGVVKDFNYKSLYEEMAPAVLQIFPDAYWKVAVKIETANASSTIAGVEKAWSKFSPNYPMQYRFMNESFAHMYKAEDKLKSLLWIFTGLAIIVGCLGLFGLAAFSAERRKKEIGIRKVLGASVENIVVLLSKDFIKLVFIAILIASPFGWYFMNSWLEDFAFRINIGWLVFIIAGIAAIAIALMTVGYHALKAALRNPVTNIRTE